MPRKQSITISADAAVRALEVCALNGRGLSRRNGDHPTYLHILLEDTDDQTDTRRRWRL